MGFHALTSAFGSISFPKQPAQHDEDRAENSPKESGCNVAHRDRVKDRDGSFRQGAAGTASQRGDIRHQSSGEVFEHDARQAPIVLTNEAAKTAHAAGRILPHRARHAPFISASSHRNCNKRPRRIRAHGVGTLCLR